MRNGLSVPGELPLQIERETPCASFCFVIINMFYRTDRTERGSAGSKPAHAFKASKPPRINDPLQPAAASEVW